MIFVSYGKTKKPFKEIRAAIDKHGGKYVQQIHSGVAAIISNKNEVNKMGSKLLEAKGFGIQVITDEYFDAVEDGGNSVELLKTMNIASWGDDPSTRFVQEEFNTKVKSKENRFTKNVPTKVVVKVQEGGAVDPLTTLENEAHIYKDRNKTYNSVLALADLQNGKNSFYKLQVLQSDTGKS